MRLLNTWGKTNRYLVINSCWASIFLLDLKIRAKPQICDSGCKLILKSLFNLKLCRQYVRENVCCFYHKGEKEEEEKMKKKKR